ncbi:MAG: formate--tetrahydrofolate ligase [Euryarchaeota archaeon]|nr:formate--tetrahydrofolate ligase [Euryarchaeota archaeon]MDE1835371.1 formate--tetrahydrofolate ligase [Euryarchaeota archaeon]MDE2043667.1 formate--tetrahydrofolate ligase [Thermoplasmata archaeon]
MTTSERLRGTPPREGGARPGLRPMAQVALDLGLDPQRIVPYGRGCAKVPATLLPELERSSTSRGKLILVTSMTPTSHGEGKTVTSIGLAMAFHTLGYRSTVCLRQPSLGPTLGLKGGGAGGGRATVEPSAEINLGFPGDASAVASAHNLLSALLDNHLHHQLDPPLDPKRIDWPRTMDLDDRALRHLRIGMGAGPGSGPEREENFVITAASEVMAVLGLAGDHQDLRERLGRILVGRLKGRGPFFARDLRAQGAMLALLRDAFQPNLVQTSEGSPAFVHTGPFANIAHGTASLLSIRMARALSDVCLVETGFGSDLGAEKFMDLVSPLGHLPVEAAVIVVTLPALRSHGGGDPDRPLEPNLTAVRAGLPNLEKHLENVEKLGLSAVVALNRFPGDRPEEVREVARFCDDRGASFAESVAYEKGGSGALELAERVLEATRKGRTGRPLLPPSLDAEEKLTVLAREIYGADGVDLSPEAKSDLDEVRAMGLGGLPVCVAKTQLSLSDDPHVRGRPRGYRIAVRRVLPRTGAGYLVATTGQISLMPGLPRLPAALDVDLSDLGDITGVR